MQPDLQRGFVGIADGHELHLSLAFFAVPTPRPRSFVFVLEPGDQTFRVNGDTAVRRPDIRDALRRARPPAVVAGIITARAVDHVASGRVSQTSCVPSTSRVATSFLACALLMT